jgi:cytoskeletal protein CcmA (bactofilin family)
MIGMNKTKPGSDAGLDRGINRIAEGTSVEGTITCESNIRIDGAFEGTLETKGRLVIGTTGSVLGAVRCNQCEVEGRLEGNVLVEELLTLKASSTLNGEIHYGALAVEAGAQASGIMHLTTKVKDLRKEDRSRKEDRVKEQPQAEVAAAR